MIPRFTSGLPFEMMRRMNIVIDTLNSLTSASSGDGRVLRSNTGSGGVSTVSQKQINHKVPHPGQLIPVRRARTRAAAGAGPTIQCNLLNFEGVEQLTGDDSNITVYCSIIGTSALNLAVPRLPNDQDVVVAFLPYSPTEYRWYMTGPPFQKSKDC